VSTAITNFNNLLISEEILQGFEVVKEVESNIGEYLKDTLKEAKDRQKLADIMISEPIMKE
jgi:hypothetical protein